MIDVFVVCSTLSIKGTFSGWNVFRLKEYVRRIDTLTEK